MKGGSNLVALRCGRNFDLGSIGRFPSYYWYVIKGDFDMTFSIPAYEENDLLCCALHSYRDGLHHHTPRTQGPNSTSSLLLFGLFQVSCSHAKLTNTYLLVSAQCSLADFCYHTHDYSIVSLFPLPAFHSLY